MNSLNFCNYDELYMLKLDDVLYIKADDHYSHVMYISSASFMLPCGLGKIEENISKQQPANCKLVRLGRKYIVNLNRILYASTSKLTLALFDNVGNKHQFRISKAVLRNLIDNTREQMSM